MAVAHRRLEQLFCIAYAAGKEFARGMVVKIGVLLGDDIGGEVVPECVKVMKAAASRSGLTIDWHPLPIGRAGHKPGFRRTVALIRH
jgi:Isocitrate/isopropylmalate dehydrogenase